MCKHIEAGVVKTHVWERRDSAPKVVLQSPKPLGGRIITTPRPKVATPLAKPRGCCAPSTTVGPKRDCATKIYAPLGITPPPSVCE